MGGRNKVPRIPCVLYRKNKQARLFPRNASQNSYMARRIISRTSEAAGRPVVSIGMTLKAEILVDQLMIGR